MRRALLLVLVTICGCGTIDGTPFPMEGPKDMTVCYDDTDCAPNGCCGEGTAIVHRMNAPDCSAVECTNSCPQNGIKCGCAVPVCRDGRCVAAISPSPDC